MKITRRRFVATAPALPAAAASGWSVLSSDDVRWLEALCEQIIPADDAPGAKEAGCVRYIDWQLAGPLKRFRPAYREGLDRLRAAKPDFPALPFAEQTRFLESIERDPFFQLLIDHTMQGYYGDPAHGGNQGRASWKMLKIDRYMEHGPWQGHTHEKA
jgi:gluconate 2-dehydrogenase gamma chain